MEGARNRQTKKKWLESRGTYMSPSLAMHKALAESTVQFNLKGEKNERKKLVMA